MSIKFETKLYQIGTWTILRLPKEASMKLPSRGMTMVEGTINSFPFRSVLEPDGKGSHWLNLSKKLLKDSKAGAGDTVKVVIETSDEWIEPELPVDFKKALSANSQANSLWDKITPNAHWDWIRWIRATKNPETRKRRIEVALSKLTKGMRRPCCFNRNACTEPSVVSNNWILLDPK